MKDRLKDHLEGWQFCENCGIKLYQKINGCSGMIHLKCHRSSHIHKGHPQTADAP